MFGALVDLLRSLQPYVNLDLTTTLLTANAATSTSTTASNETALDRLRALTAVADTANSAAANDDDDDWESE